MRGSIGALPCREVGSEAVGHVAACGCMPYTLSRLEACMRGYLVYRVLIVAPKPSFLSRSSSEI
jgi:hypothetical protein